MVNIIKLFSLSGTLKAFTSSSVISIYLSKNLWNNYDRKIWLIHYKLYSLKVTRKAIYDFEIKMAPLWYSRIFFSISIIRKSCKITWQGVNCHVIDSYLTIPNGFLWWMKNEGTRCRQFLWYAVFYVRLLCHI